jgi:predicted dehydrogenase
MAGAIAQVGYGYWGTNIARNLNACAGGRWKYLVDLATDRLAKAESLYPHVCVTDEFSRVLADDAVGAVVIATPASTHASLTRAALAAGKHVYVEKPLAVSVDDAVDVASLADRNDLILMVGHIFEYVPAVQKMKEIIDEGGVGDVVYLHSQRLDLPQIRSDIDAFWDLGPHDIAIANLLQGSDPAWVAGRGSGIPGEAVADIFLVTIGYPSGVLAHIHVSRLDPLKTRRTTVVGTRQMLVYDDMDLDSKLKVFERASDHLDIDAYGAYQSRTRDSAMYVPSLPMVEPLAVELQHFLDCVDAGKRPHTDGWNGVRVVAVLEAAVASWRAGGVETPVVFPRIPTR